jgi:DNA repair protein RecN (Recombination protein N)
MLSELHILNLVILERAQFSPGLGLSVITGETGHGKSLLLDAIDLVSGARARQGLVGRWGNAAEVTAVFQVSPERGALVESACGIAPCDQELILRRRIGEGTRSGAWINDVPVTVTALRAAADHLIDLHAQHEPIRLADASVQMGLLDGYAGSASLAAEYQAAHQKIAPLERQIEQLSRADAEAERELDYLRFQAKQFEEIDPRPGELPLLEERHHILSEGDHWRGLAAELAHRLGEDERSLSREIARAARKLEQAPDPRLKSAFEALLQARVAIDEAAAQAAAVAESEATDPEELERIAWRLDRWNDLLRKHGPDETSVLSARNRIATRIEELASRDERLLSSQRELAEALAVRNDLGTRLAASRREAFGRLTQALRPCLMDLGMPKAELVLHEDPRAAPSPVALLHQEWWVSTNPGLAPGSIRAIASGGEAARLMLAISTVLAAQNAIPLMVFDEVDSGVGGRLGVAIGTHLARLAAGRTVLAVTHTPQVAAAASRQVVVRKLQGDVDTTVQVREMAQEDRITEIADMLGGGPAALAQAKELMLAAAASTPVAQDVRVTAKTRTKVNR